MFLYKFYLISNFRSYAPDMNNIMKYAMENKSRKWDFNCQKAKKRTLYKIYNEHFKQNYVGFGDYSRSDDCIVRLRRPPIKEFRNFILTNQTVVSEVDEFNTSKLCHKCYGVMHAFDFRTDDIKPLDARGRVPFTVLKKCDKCNIIYHRDKNASLNILQKLIRNIKGDQEPEEFINTFKFPRIDQNRMEEEEDDSPPNKKSKVEKN